MSFNETPNAVRLHIGIFGKRNSGKSTLLNTITGQKISTVSPIAGTTTDPVIKAMELHGLGPVVFYDTAGFDDEGELGALRVEKQRRLYRKQIWRFWCSVILIFPGKWNGMMLSKKKDSCFMYLE